MRLGGAYELFHLAQDTENLRQTVMDILCAHIRQTTGERKYRKDYPSKPSEEIQSLLTLLFVQDHEIFKGCHINLQGSWFNGADLNLARLYEAVLVKVHLQGAHLLEAKLDRARLQEAQLQGADLAGAHLQEVDLVKARMQGAFLDNARLQGSILNEAWLHGTLLTNTKLQETGLNGTYLQGANLACAHLQKASLGGAYLQGTILLMTRFHGAILRDAQMQGAYLRAAQLHEAQFSSLQGTQNLSERVRRGINPESAQLQGISSSSVQSLEAFRERIREGEGKESDLSGAILSGGLTSKYVESLVADLSEAGARELRELLAPHIDRPVTRELPENNGATTGAYTEEEAERWIAEYEEAMSEVPKADNGQ